MCRAREGDAFLFDVKLDAKTRELLVGAEMSRRAFTNACNIMRRHDFARHWERWRRSSAARGREPPAGHCSATSLCKS